MILSSFNVINTLIDIEPQKFDAYRFHDTNHPEFPMIARFPSEESLAHFLLVWE